MRVTQAQKAYRQFLKSQFWKELSARVKAGRSRCQDCRKRRPLQAHHVRYPDNWYDTKESDLRLLCRVCHLKRHGFEVVVNGVMPYRGDPFDLVIHRTVMLRRKLESWRPLRDRDRKFLDKAQRLFTPTDTDRCVQFHCQQVYRWEKMMAEAKDRPQP